MTAIIISVVLILVVVGLDQASKYAIVAMFGVGDHIGKGAEAMDSVARGLDSIDIIPGVFRLSFVVNDGAAFGSMDDNRWLFMILSTIAIIGILVYMFWKKPQNPLLLASLVLITGGGIGNMIDRVALGYVIDFFDFCALPNLWMWVFNVADSCVCIGAALMALWLVIDLVKETKKEKAKKLAEAAKAAVDETNDTDKDGNGESGDSNE